MLRERTIISFLLSVVLIFMFGYFKPDPDRSVFEEKWFWVWKTHSKNQYDVVILGDSRVYRGVSPETMERILPGFRILNFGYSSGSLAERMLSDAEKKLDATGKRVIILGVTPVSLTPRSALDEHYLQEKNRDRGEILKTLYLGHLANFFAPTTPMKLFKSPSHTYPIYYQEFYKSGWVASWKEPENPNEALESYANAFNGNLVSSDIEEHLLDRTARWVKEGICVLAFRPPTSQEMVNLENGLSGFDEEQFIDKFTKSGGIWIPIPVNEYHSYDGSHIDKESAIRLSHFLAEKIKAMIEERKTS